MHYYASAEGDHLRIEGRRTRYGPLSYELLPRRGEFTLDSARTRAHIARLVPAIMNSELPAAITAERNLANFIGEMNAGLKRRSSGLLQDIERAR